MCVVSLESSPSAARAAPRVDKLSPYAVGLSPSIGKWKGFFLLSFLWTSSIVWGMTISLSWRRYFKDRDCRSVKRTSWSSTDSWYFGSLTRIVYEYSYTNIHRYTVYTVVCYTTNYKLHNNWKSYEKLTLLKPSWFLTFANFFFQYIDVV